MGVIKLCKGETLMFGKFTPSKQSTTYMYTLPSYILHYILPLAENPQLHTYSLVRVLLYRSPSIITDIPSSPIEFPPMLRTCRLQFFKTLPTQLAPVVIVNNLH